MVAFGGKLLLAMYGSHSGASRLSAVWRLSAFWRVRYRRFHCSYNTMAAGWSAQETKMLVSIWGEADVQSQLDGVIRSCVSSTRAASFYASTISSS